jgi:hypothetical protein
VYPQLGFSSAIRTINLEVPHDPWSANTSSLGEVPFLRNQTPMPAQQGVRGDDGVEFEQRLSPYGFGLARRKSPLSIGEADSTSPQSVLQQSVLGLKESDDN